MEGSWFRRVFVGGTLGVAMLLSSAVLAQAQTCTARYNPLQRQYETQCANDLSSLYGLLGNSSIKPYAEVERTVLQNEAQRLQNELMRLQLRELQRQQALRQYNGQR